MYPALFEWDKNPRNFFSEQGNFYLEDTVHILIRVEIFSTVNGRPYVQERVRSFSPYHCDLSKSMGRSIISGIVNFWGQRRQTR